MHTETPIIYEEHCSVLAEWWARGMLGRTLVYLDAHLDLQYVNETRLKKLRQAETPTQFRGLEKPHHLLPDGDYVYGLENFLYPASRLGIIDHLIWIAPPHIHIGQTVQVYQYLQQMDGVTIDDIRRIRRLPSGCFEANLLGLKITFCRLEDIGRLNLTDGFLLDIDTDYFVALPEDRAWLDPAAVFTAFERLHAQPGMISIARSVSSGFMPLRYRYFADYLKALWEADRPSIMHFSSLFHTARDLEVSPNSTSLVRLAGLSNARPECPATRHVCKYFHQPSRGRRSSAAELDPGYRFDPVRIMSGLANRHLPINLHTLNRLRTEYQVADEIWPSEACIALGIAYARIGGTAQALACYQAYGRPHPALALEIAQLLDIHSCNREAQTLLETAVTEDCSYSLGHLLLAQLHLHNREPKRACAHLELVRERAPAWQEPLALLRRAHEMLGDHASAEHDVRVLKRQNDALQQWNSG
jgi:hypothetical protein